VIALSSRQRKYLRGAAHALEPVVHVGKGGVTAELAAELDRALDAHELVKVRFVAGKREKAELVDELCTRTGAATAGTVGHVAVLYRPQADPQRRRIRLPEP
jgi:RNA-binding protein